MTAQAMTFEEIELSSGPLEYHDSGGDGAVVVMLHGLLMDAALWADVVAELSPTYRCIVPTLPLGAHRIPSGREVSLTSVTKIVAELLKHLSLENVTIAGNDTGGAIAQLLIANPQARIGSVVLVSCDAFDNFPPGLTGKVLVLMGRLPTPLFGAFMQQLRLRRIRRLPIAFGWLTKRGDAITARWVRQLLSNAAIQRDTVCVLRSIAADRDLLVRAAESLPSFYKPSLVIWSTGDRVMPPAHGRRLAETLPQSRLVEITDSYTLIPLDQPVELAKALHQFLEELPPA
jgi:pimeloyl-ACP methyl ester carboxylesterase